jgi:hypothetical protein
MLFAVAAAVVTAIVAANGCRICDPFQHPFLLVLVVCRLQWKCGLDFDRDVSRRLCRLCPMISVNVSQADIPYKSKLEALSATPMSV